jgi:hypothetical protein
MLLLKATVGSYVMCASVIEILRDSGAPHVRPTIKGRSATEHLRLKV